MAWIGEALKMLALQAIPENPDKTAQKAQRLVFQLAGLFVSAVLVMMTLCRTSQVYRLQLKKIRFYGDMLVRIVRIGLPAGLQSVMYSLSNIIIQASVNGFGTDVMAAYTAYGKVDGMYWMVINAFGVAITTFVGQNFGARLYDRMKKSINVCLGISAAVTIASTHGP